MPFGTVGPSSIDHCRIPDAPRPRRVAGPTHRWSRRRAHRWSRRRAGHCQSDADWFPPGGVPQEWCRLRHLVHSRGGSSAPGSSSPGQVPPGVPQEWCRLRHLVHSRGRGSAPGQVPRRCAAGVVPAATSGALARPGFCSRPSSPALCRKSGAGCDIWCTRAAGALLPAKFPSAVPQEWCRLRHLVHSRGGSSAPGQVPPSVPQEAGSRVPAGGQSGSGAPSGGTVVATFC